MSSEYKNPKEEIFSLKYLQVIDKLNSLDFSEAKTVALAVNDQILRVEDCGASYSFDMHCQSPDELKKGEQYRRIVVAKPSGINASSIDPIQLFNVLKIATEELPLPFSVVQDEFGKLVYYEAKLGSTWSIKEQELDHSSLELTALAIHWLSIAGSQMSQEEARSLFVPGKKREKELAWKKVHNQAKKRPRNKIDLGRLAAIRTF